MDVTLQNWLGRARRRWRVARALDAGGRWAMLPAALAAIAAGAVLLAAPGATLAVIGFCIAGVLGALAAVLVVGAMHTRARKPGAADWALALDRHLALDDQLVTYLEGAGSFAPVLHARLVAQSDRPPHAAFPLRVGSLAVALMLALLPLGLIAWQPTARPQSSEVAKAEGAQAEIPAAPGCGEPMDGAGSGSPPDKGGRKGPGETPAPTGSTPAPDKPQNIGTKSSDNPGKPGDKPAPRPPKEPDKPEKVDSRDLPIKPDAGEGERRAEERRRWIYDEHGKPMAGSTPGADWKSRAEEAIPRLKITSRERKLLEDWFRQLGGN